MPHRNGRNLSIWLVGLLTVALTMTITQIAGAAPNPPGNNGTIKVDREPFDNAPNNEPHVGCTFQVDFYGFDKGDLDAQVTFVAHPPTGERQVLLTDDVFIGEDDNSGGGSEAGLDASKTYTLPLSGIKPHIKQGVHVKLTVHAEGSQGADTKHKVFWVTPCEAATTTTTTTVGQTTTTTVGQTTTTTVGQTTTTGGQATTTLGASTSTAGQTTGSGAGGKGATSSLRSSGLPFTGANSLPVLIAGLLLLIVGAGGVLASRHLRAR